MDARGNQLSERWKQPSRRTACLLAALTLLSIGAVAASPAAGRAVLDPSFGQAGRTMIAPPASEGFVEAGLMRDGDLAIATDRSLERLGPDGRLDLSFGQGGVVTPPVPPGGKLEIAGLAVDSQDRLIVAGTALPPAGHPFDPFLFGPGFETGPKKARVVRYLPSGVLDPAFGDGGVVETDLGLPAPLKEDGTQIVPSPWVEVTGVAVDSQDRVVLTGGVSAGLRGNCAHDWYWDTLTYAAFVARLTAAGGLDSTYGQSGIFGGRSVAEYRLHNEASDDPELGPRDEVTYGTGVLHCPRAGGAGGLSRLDAGGNPAIGFGTRGAVRMGSDDMVVLPGGGVANIGFQSPWYYTQEAATAEVTRLTPNGRPDRGFGTRGMAIVETPGGAGGQLSSIAADGRGRLLLAGTMTAVKGDRGHRGKPRRQRLFVLMRVTAGGRLDRAFGPGGRVAARFGSRNASGSQVLLDSQGRAVLVGTYGRYGHEGVAVARYTIIR